MQAFPSVSPSTSHPYTTAPHASLTIDPAALLNATATTAASPSATGSASIAAKSVGNVLDSATADSTAVKQEPNDEHTPTLLPLRHGSATPQQGGSTAANKAIDDAGRAGSTAQGIGRHKSVELGESKLQTTEESTSLVDQFLKRDHKAILRPDLSAFNDARDALGRLLPYHVWNIPHQDLLRALNLKEDPVLSEVRLRKRRRISHLNSRRHATSIDEVTKKLSITDEPSQPAEVAAEAGPSTIKADTSDGMQLDETSTAAPDTKDDIARIGNDGKLEASEEDAQLNELGLPTPLPDIPLPLEFPSLDYAESVFSRRDALASRFNRTLSALDTTHKRAPNTSLSLEHLQRLAYNDDREQVLAQIEELKALKAKLEALEETKQINVSQSSAKINLRFGITDEIEREREKERELERIKRQQERAAAKAARLEKEREARHRIGIFTPPPEPPSTPKASLSALTQSPAPPASVGVSMAPPPISTSASFASPSPYSAVSTPASTPAGYPFPQGANLPYAAQHLPMHQAGPNGFPMPSPQYGPPSAYSSMPGTPGFVPPFGAVPGPSSYGSNGMPMPIGTPTSAPFIPATGAPSTPAAGTPSKPPSKKAAKAAAAAAAAAASAPGTPGTPGVTPGPTPHRGRGRPRKHPLPGTPGGPPIGSSAPKKKKEKLPKQPATPGTPSAVGSAMSPPAMPGAMQVRPPSASPAPPTMPGPAPGYSGETFASILPPTPTTAGSPPAGTSSTVRPPTMHPTLTSATSLNTPRDPAKPSTSPSPATTVAATKKAPPAKPSPAANGSTTVSAAPAAAPSATAPAPAPAPNANPSIPNHPIPLLIPVASLPRLSALGIQPTPSPHIRPIIGPNGQPQGLQGLPIPINPAQDVPAVLLGISEGQAEAGTGSEGKQQILHISVVLSRLSPSQLSGLAVLMQSLQAQVEAGKRK